MPMRRVLLWLLSLLVIAPVTAAAQDLPDWVKRTKISGLAFGDVYLMAANHNPALESANGLWFRRVYLTLDNQIAKEFTFRIRYEMNSAGDFRTSSTLNPYVKDLYLKWARSNTQVLFGIVGTPTWDLAEGFWGFRDVEKTPLDLQKLGSSRDVGIQVKGWVDSKGKVSYTVMLGQGSDTKGETNTGKKGYVALAFRPVKGFLAEVYADKEELPGARDRYVVQGLLGYEGAWGRVGVLAARQHRQLSDTTAIDLDVMSAFLVAKVSPKVKVLGRVDRMFNPNPDGATISYLPFDPTAKSTLVMGGIDLALDARFHLIPNIQVVLYDGVTPKPSNDLMLRTTFSITF